MVNPNPFDPQQSNINNFKIIEVNANSLVSVVKRHNLDIFINKHKPDALIVCETHLNIRHNFKLAGYNIIRTDRKCNRRGGGTAIIINNHFNYTHIHTSTLDLGNAEITAIKINLINNTSIFLI